MTPKEKAEELVNKFTSIKNVKLSDYSIIYLPTAKHCALIAVEEILDFMDMFDLDLGMKNQHKWWKEVKQEIENL